MRNRHWTIGDGGRCRLNQMSGRASPQEPVDVKNAESEDERVDGAEDNERNRASRAVKNGVIASAVRKIL